MPHVMELVGEDFGKFLSHECGTLKYGISTL